MSRGPAKAVLVTFCARDGDPYERNRHTGEYQRSDPDDRMAWGPLLRLVADPASDLKGRIDTIYYLCHPSSTMADARRSGRSALEVAKEMQAALTRHLPLTERPFLHEVTWRTNKPPNDHRDLFDVVRTNLREIRARHPVEEIILQLSSGTSAMHAVLLIAGTVGIISGPLRLIQSERDKGANTRRMSPYADVNLELPTILQVVRQTASASGEDSVPEFSYDEARSPRLRETVAALAKAAKIRSPLLLRGERGVGKSSLAKVVRAASPFRKQPRNDKAEWASLACGQFADPTLLYVELCGAVQGAYTGLQKDRHGLLRLADRDILFLDEVHDLDHRCQRAIIRLIEDGTYTRLGDEGRLLHSRFRLIAGTNLSDSDLQERLSADFLDRIRDLEILIPPLRDCSDDLPAMWRAVRHHAAVEHGIPVVDFMTYDEEVVRVLRGHPLHGNWRDLRRLATRFSVELIDKSSGAGDAVRTVLKQFCRPDGPEAHSSKRNGAFLRNKHAANTLQKLEVVLGPGLERFWSACEKGHDPNHVLRELLGDNRNKARYAAEFIQRSFAQRWLSLASNGLRAERRVARS